MQNPCPYCGAVSPRLCLAERAENERVMAYAERERFVESLRYHDPRDAYPLRHTSQGLYEVRSIEAWDAATRGASHPELRRLAPRST